MKSSKLNTLQISFSVINSSKSTLQKEIRNRLRRYFFLNVLTTDHARNEPATWCSTWRNHLHIFDWILRKNKSTSENGRNVPNHATKKNLSFNKNKKCPTTRIHYVQILFFVLIFSNKEFEKAESLLIEILTSSNANVVTFTELMNLYDAKYDYHQTLPEGQQLVFLFSFFWGFKML